MNRVLELALTSEVECSDYCVLKVPCVVMVLTLSSTFSFFIVRFELKVHMFISWVFYLSIFAVMIRSNEDGVWLLELDSSNKERLLAVMAKGNKERLLAEKWN